MTNPRFNDQHGQLFGDRDSQRLEGNGERFVPREEALDLLDGLELKPRKAFGPIRVAVTGATVSPPLFESMELLGRDRSLARLQAARNGL